MIAVVFPGQGSQKPGMGADFFETPAAAEIVEEIEEATGFDVRMLCLELDEEVLRQTENAQMALFACGLMAKACLPIRAQVLAGHSIGEYAALTAAGAISVGDGARLVQKRGELMATSGADRPGGMAAVLGLERAEIEKVCATVTDGVVVVANDNCPGQLVISGDLAAVQAAAPLLTEAGAKRVIPLNVSGAFHSPLMEDSAKEMRKALDQVEFRRSQIRVVSNVTSESNDDPAKWPQLLEDQLRSPVRWTESIQNMIAAGVTTFIECGGGEVLSGLIRRINRDVKTLSVGDSASLEKTISELAATSTP